MPELSFTEQGAGKPIVLLHGFPMNQTVWKEFIPLLTKTNTVITLDLPGFGNSDILKQPFTLDQVADCVLDWLLKKNILGSTLIGHSLGGYVALAMAAKKATLFSALGLFHSTAYADTEEKKESRLKVIDFVEKNGALAFTANFIPPLFVDQHHPAIDIVRKIAIQSSAEAVVGYTQAMRQRPDRIDVLEKLKMPILFLAGDKDAGIPVDSILKQAKHCQSPAVHILNTVAHMGMFESSEAASSIISAFAR